MANARQKRVSQEAVRLLAAGVSGQVFPGASACIAWREPAGAALATAWAGVTQPGASPVDAQTFYDLASLTKPIVATAALRLHAAGALPFDVKVESVLTDIRGSVAGTATLEQLLTHRARLAPWGGLYLDVPHEVGTSAARRWIIGEAARRPSEAPKTPCLYSDLGYIVAGEFIARSLGRSLDQVVAAEVTEPLGIAAELFYPPTLSGERRAAFERAVAATERCEWRGRIVRGEVHDENCAALGGVSGHAGLFGTASAVATFGRAMLDVLAGTSAYLPRAVLEHALAERPGGSHRLGWDAKSAAPDSAAGRRLGPDTFGHLGFTGTSLWCDPGRDLAVVLLTNRVFPSRANEKIKGFRPAFHDGVVAAYDG